MAKKVAISVLNARSIDIVNVIRQNASYEYQQNIPAITSEKDLPAVGEALYGYPALANQFINALINRIALVRVKSATFNNPFVDLKKGYLENGETVEEVFTEIAKAREFNVEKAEQRELKRTLPDVRSAFHTMNWRVQYPVTIQNEDLRMAFLSAEGVTDLIAKIVDTVYRAAEYDEYLLFKYLMIKAIAQGKMKPVAVDMSDIKNSAVAFRGISNKLTFVGTQYNIAGVHVNTDKADQYIFMDSEFNAQFDVNVLASAFNMDKADFMGRLHLVDDWGSFDNDRFSEIVDATDMIEPVTAEELAITADVKAVLVVLMLEGDNLMISRNVTVKNSVGLHARPATFFIQKANSFKCSIWVEKEDCRVNAKSLLGVLSLGISSGTDITIIADGQDEQIAIDALVALIDSGFIEG